MEKSPSQLFIDCCGFSDVLRAVSTTVGHDDDERQVSLALIDDGSYLIELINFSEEDEMDPGGPLITRLRVSAVAMETIIAAKLTIDDEKLYEETRIIETTPSSGGTRDAEAHGPESDGDHGGAP